MIGTEPGAKTLKGLLCPVFVVRREVRTKPGESRLKLWGAGGTSLRACSGKCVRGDRAKPRSRLSRENPRRVKPKGAASGWRAKHTSGRQGLSKGSKPRNRGLSGRPAASAARATTGETVGGCFRAVTRRIPFERGRLRRANPRSAAGVKQNRHGTAGRKPSRG
jgi:hypothetical protein